MTMARLFGEADLQRVAGERSFGRGEGYLDAVGDLEIGVGQVTATVYGTDAYEVVLDLGDGLSRVSARVRMAGKVSSASIWSRSG